MAFGTRARSAVPSLSLETGPIVEQGEARAAATGTYDDRAGPLLVALTDDKPSETVVIADKMNRNTLASANPESSREP